MKKIRLKESDLVNLIRRTISKGNDMSRIRARGLSEQTQLDKSHELSGEFKILNRKLDRILKFVTHMS